MTPHPDPLDASLLLTSLLRAAAADSINRLPLYNARFMTRAQQETFHLACCVLRQADRELGMGASGQQTAEPFAEVV